MSIEHVENFVSALKANASLQAEIKRKDGGSGGLAALLEVAQAHGYDISLDEVNTYLRTQCRDLTDEELNNISGGVVIAIIAILIG